MATRSAKIDQKADLIWAIADKLTGVYKPHEYGDVILPLTVIRRFDCILSDTKDAVLQKYDEVKNLPMKDILLRKASKKDFYNTSKYTFERLMDDPDHIEENFREYLNKFSANVRDILEKFKFDGHITTMANKGILYIVLKEYTTDRGNLHPNEISNLEMGYIFEEIIRRFSESHNEDAGQHYTPREVIQLMVNILFYDDNDILSGNNVAKTIYDPACGTGGMLSVAEEYLHSLNASTELVSFGQEINDQTFAICKIKEQIEKYYIKHPDEFGSEREQCLLWLNRNKINKYDELPKTNARLEALKEKAFTGGAEKYLWIPPSLPYYEMQGAYKNSKGFSKILVFSAWEMVPRMIGALVSYEAERLTVGKLVHQIKNQDKKNTGYFADGSRRYPVARLRFNVSNGEVRGMSLFALLYPSKTLSDMYLPIESLNNHESLEVIEKSVRLKLKEKLAIIEEKYGDSGNNKEDARWYYLAPMLMDGVIYAKHWIEDIVWEMNTDEEDTTSEVRSSSKDKRNKGFIAHIDKLRSYLDAPEEIHLGRKPEDLLETLVNMVLGSPAICIYRSNGRSTARATSLAKVFVNNFNLPESTAIIDLAYGRCRDDNSHWQNVLKYCKDGCFQAMIDEYIHMLKETAGFQSDGNQYQIVHDMMMDSLKIHTATYIADTYPDFKKRINGADRKSDGCRIRSSYAVGFTKDAGDNSKVVMRKENIRNAFNSPMRPFVLATTSIGQEGLDFHNYCRVIMHWNLPSNPIDVGRILRTFKIKKNVEVTDNGKIII